MLDVLLLIVALTALLIASYLDIKTREIPDWLNFSLIAAALGIRSIAAAAGGWPILFSGLIGLAVCFVIALFLYYSNQWGGGDSKLLMAMGAIIGVSLPISKESFTLVWFIISLLFLGMIWGLAWMAGVAIKKKHLFAARFRHSLSSYKILHGILALFTLATIALVFFYPLFWPFLLFPLPVFYLFMFVNSVEKSCFYTRKLPEELTEGDWLAENVAVDHKTVLFKKTLTKKDLFILSNLKKKRKINTVLIKEGIPFIPAFLYSYILVIFFERHIFQLLGLIF